MYTYKIKNLEEVLDLFKFLPDEYRAVKWNQGLFTDEVKLNKKMSSIVISSMTADSTEAENIFTWILAVFGKAKVLVCLLPFRPC